jgi:hypothetical protein
MTAPAAGGDVARLHTALTAPGGASAAGLAALTGQPEAWVYAHLDDGADTGTVVRLGHDPIARTGRYRATAPAASVPALLAAALTILTDRGLCQGAYLDDDTGAVDLTGALRIAGGVHPRALLADDQALVVALCDAEDEIARTLGVDPTTIDAGEALAGWVDQPGRTVDDAVALLDTALGAVGVPTLAGAR